MLGRLSTPGSTHDSEHAWVTSQVQHNVGGAWSQCLPQQLDPSLLIPNPGPVPPDPKELSQEQRLPGNMPLGNTGNISHICHPSIASHGAFQVWPASFSVASSAPRRSSWKKPTNEGVLFRQVQERHLSQAHLFFSLTQETHSGTGNLQCKLPCKEQEIVWIIFKDITLSTWNDMVFDKGKKSNTYGADHQHPEGHRMPAVSSLVIPNGFSQLTTAKPHNTGV